MDDSDNDGRYPDDSPVLTRYPGPDRAASADREAWPWLPGSIVQQCGPDEWQVCVESEEAAVREDGSPVTPDTPADERYYPLVFRDSGELREPEPEAG